MNNSSKLVEKVEEVINPKTKNLLERGNRSSNILCGAEVVFDKHIPYYSVKRKEGLTKYFGNFPLGEEHMYMPMDERKITAFRNPNFILTIKGSFAVDAKVELLSLEDYIANHREFLRKMTRYGFIHEGEGESGRNVSVFQEIVDKECDIYEEIISKYE